MPVPHVSPALWLLLTLLTLVSGQAPIKIGMTGPLADDTGTRMSAGLRFAFQEANNAGGILGRNLTLIPLEDGWNATRAMANIQRLLDVENVLLLAGVVGSDIVDVAKPLILQRGVPYVGPYSGTASLHTPFNAEFINIRASYNDEVVAQATFLVQNTRVQRIACLYQNDAFGIGGHAALVAALANVGLQLVAAGSYMQGRTDVEAALEAIACANSRPQAVVMIALQAPIIKFINLHTADNRSDPECIYTVMSPGWGTTFSTQLNRTLWGRVYFFFVVPAPSDTAWAISRHFTAVYPTVPGVISFEGYIVGRFIVEVLRQIRSASPTRAMFLDQVYASRLLVLDDLVLGMYSTNYSGCEQALCACNSGLRSVYTGQLDSKFTGYLKPGLATVRYSVLHCSNPVSNVVAPLLFGQLMPDGDAGWRAVALAIGDGIDQAFAEANRDGGAGGRGFLLIRKNYTANLDKAITVMSDRYPLLAFLGSVVWNTGDIDLPVPSIGSFDIRVDTEDTTFVRDQVGLKPTTSLEVMALVNWAVETGCAIHLRAPATADGPPRLAMLTKAVHSFQLEPTSAELYLSANDALASTERGCLIALGSDDDVLSWYVALPAYPALHLLTLSGPVMRLMALSPNASVLPQASRLHFSTPAAAEWNATLPSTEPSEAWKYGYVVGQAVVQALLHSEYAAKPYTTPAQLLDAWYTVKLMTVGTLSFGPYSDDPCDGQTAECECNEGAPALAVRSAASPEAAVRYSIATCHVVYTPLRRPDHDVVLPAVVGSVAGALGLVLVAVVLLHRATQRNNAAAPQDETRPFCVLFTDIQASTHLWATLPDVMAPALDRHHALIRKLVAKHRCYEVKTIGDSFMCAAHSPPQAMRLALAIQHEFHEERSDEAPAINAAYHDLLALGELESSLSLHACWNGLRVRVGLHFGHGNIKRDPVSRGFDYYGTVVNVAARIENVCHGGQIGVSQAVYDAVRQEVPGVVWADLGCHVLRGLAEPLQVYQALPAGRLARRTFPPLRLDKAVQDFGDDVELEVVTGDMSHDSSTALKPNRVAPTDSHAASSSLTAESFGWVDAHPLVVRGEVAAEELRRLYLIATATLATLLATQTEKFRQQMVQGLCERLHVANHGTRGVALQRTLRGLVHRVLPATVVNVQQQLQKCLTRQNSKATLPASPTSPLRATSFWNH